MKKNYTKTLLTFIVSLLCCSQGWAADVEWDVLNGSNYSYSGTNNVTLKNRSFAANTWEGLCLPFSVSATTLESVFGTNYNLQEFDSYENNIIKFKNATAVEAGKPYYIKIASAVSDPVFSNVTFGSSLSGWQDVTVDDNMSFRGFFYKIHDYQLVNGQADTWCFWLSGNTLLNKNSIPWNDNGRVGTQAFFFLKKGDENTTTPSISFEGSESGGESGEGGESGGESSESGGSSSGGGSTETLTPGFTDLGSNTIFGNGENGYQFVGDATTMVEGATVTITATGDNVVIHLVKTDNTGWKRAKSFTLTSDDVTSLANNNYMFYVAAWDGITVSNITITAPGGSSGSGGESGGGSSTKTLAEKIAAKEQLTDVPTLYFTIPSIPEGADVNTYLKKENNVAEYLTAEIQVVDKTEGGLKEFTDNVQIKVRGNSTAKETKKPYRLKFKDIKDEAGNVVATSQKHDLLGKGYAKRNWALLANYIDPAMVRNALTYKIGELVDMPFKPGYKFADVVINGEYRGTYQITDHVEVGTNRIDIDEDTGWFVESARGDMVEQPSASAASLFMSIKNPEPATDEETATLKSQIESWFQPVDALFCIYNGTFDLNAFTNPTTGWRKYWDEESLVNFYLGINITGDYDGFMTVKMYRDLNKKLKFGPLWDKDLAFGNYESDNGTKLAEDQQSGSYFASYVKKLWLDPVFVKKVHDKMATLVANGLATTLENYVDALVTETSQTEALNHTKWPRYGNWSSEFTTREQAITQLKGYLAPHITWLKETIDAQYEALGGDAIVDNTIPGDSYSDGTTPGGGEEEEETPVGDLGALAELDNGKYSFTGSASTFKEGTVITITTTNGTTLSNYITEGTEWNTTKSITLTADDVTALAANSYTFYMVATDGEVKAVNVKVPVSNTGAEFNKEIVSSYTTASSSEYFVVPASHFNSNATSIKITFKNNASNYSSGWNANYAFDGTPWNGYTIQWTTTQTYEKTIDDSELIQSAATKGMGVGGPTDMTITVINYGSSSGSTSTPQYTLTLNASEGGTVTGAGTYDEGTTVLIKAIANDGYTFTKWSDDNTHATRSVTLSAAMELTATFAVESETPAVRQQLTNLPTIYLDATTVGNEWSAATLKVFDADNKLTQGTEWESTAVEVQYQGGHSAGTKDSYRLKFGNKTKLLSSGKFKQWVLASNDDDPSMINNAMAKELGDLVGMPFTPGYQFVDLYLNDTYMGTYQVTDRIKTESGRALVTGGNKDADWHVRINDNDEITEGGYTEDKYITATSSMPNLVIKNPDPDDFTDATALATLKNDMSTWFTSVFTKDASGHYSSVADNVDKQQLINWYICQEVMAIYKGLSSIEAYRSITDAAADKMLHFGPLWDNETAFGNQGDEDEALSMSDLNTADSYNGLIFKYNKYDLMKSFFENLWTQSWFACGVRDKWSALVTAGLLATLKDKASTISAMLSESQPKNAEKWTNSLKTNNKTYSTYSDAVAAIATYLDERVPYLTTKFNALAEGMCNHTFEYADNNDGTHKHYCTTCNYTDITSEAHTLTINANNKPQCSVCNTEINATVSGSQGDKVYILNAGKSNVQYITKTGGFTPTTNTLYPINEQPEEGTSFDNVYWTNENGTNYADNIVVTDGSAWLGDVKVSANNATYSRAMSSTSVWGTICLPFKIESNDDVALYQLSSSTADLNGNGTMVFTEATSTGGLTPLVFKKKTNNANVVFKCGLQEDSTVTVKATEKMSKNKPGKSVTLPSGWAFYGNVQETQTKTTTADASPALYYIASNKFWHATGTLNVTPFRAYFEYTVPSNAKPFSMFSISEQDNISSTDISSVSSTLPLAIFTGTGSVSIVAPKDMQVVIYNAHGAMIESIKAQKDKEYTVYLPSGIYVVNGNKFIVK